MSLSWQDMEEMTKWQTDNTYVPSNCECVGRILATCACVQFSQQYYALRGD